jgi:RimJ/RimL family protein N-acetyltransferase
MKQNYEICLVTEKTTLVPYRPEHVERYHEWMKHPDLLEATDSEPLSLAQEVEMQQSWRDDPMKCTFIVHSTEHCPGSQMKEFTISENLCGMVGDVNLFLSNVEESEDDETNNETKNDDLNRPALVQAEIDIMIAENNFKRQGLGKSATCSMMLYGANVLKVHRFFCKINEDNIGSIKLFEGLGFVQCAYAACFKQVELELIEPLAELNEILKPFGDYKIIRCAINGNDTE